MLLRLILLTFFMIFASCVPTANKSNKEENLNLPGDESVNFVAPAQNNTVQNSSSSSSGSSVGQNATTSPSSFSSTTTSSVAQTITGKLMYERVPVSSEGKLDFESKSYVPLRHAKIEVFNPADMIIQDTTYTDENGYYTMTVTQEKTVQLKVYAESEGYAMQVQDNTNNDQIYYYLSRSYNPFNTPNFNVNIPSGWFGENDSGLYDGPRFSAPFAIMDTLIGACKIMRASQIKFFINEQDYCSKSLKINWKAESTVNMFTQYNRAENEIYVKALKDIDSDEYDQHVLINVFMQYFLANYARNDSIGGPHSPNFVLDPTQAFVEGFSQAMAGILLENKYYSNTAGSRGQSPLEHFSLEYEQIDKDGPGHSAYNEQTVREIIWDIWDDVNEGYDKLHVDLEKIILAIKASDFVENHALSTMYSFSSNFIDHYSWYEYEMNYLLKHRGIYTLDPYAEGEKDVKDEKGNYVVIADGKARVPLYSIITVDDPDPTQLNFVGSTNYFNESKNIHNVRFSTVYKGSTIKRYRITVTSPSPVSIEVFDNGKLAVSSPQTPILPTTFKEVEVCDPTLDLEDEYVVRLVNSPSASAANFNATIQVSSVAGDCP